MADELQNEDADRHSAKAWCYYQDDVQQHLPRTSKSVDLQEYIVSLAFPLRETQFCFPLGGQIRHSLVDKVDLVPVHSCSTNCWL